MKNNENSGLFGTSDFHKTRLLSGRIAFLWNDLFFSTKKLESSVFSYPVIVTVTDWPSSKSEPGKYVGHFQKECFYRCFEPAEIVHLNTETQSYPSKKCV